MTDPYCPECDSHHSVYALCAHRVRALVCGDDPVAVAADLEAKLRAAQQHPAYRGLVARYTAQLIVAGQIDVHAWVADLERLLADLQPANSPTPK